MKKTEYKVMTSYGISNGATYRRLYTDDDDKRYIKTKEGYQCVEGTKCLDYIFREVKGEVR